MSNDKYKPNTAVAAGYDVNILNELERALMLGDKLVVSYDIVDEIYSVTAAHDDGSVTSVAEPRLEWAIRRVNQKIAQGVTAETLDTQGSQNAAVAAATGVGEDTLESAEQAASEELETEQERQQARHDAAEKAAEERKQKLKEMTDKLNSAIGKAGLVDDVWNDDLKVDKAELEKDLQDPDKWSVWINGVAVLDHGKYGGDIIARYDFDLDEVFISYNG